MQTNRPRVLFVVNPDPIHVGAHFLRAAVELGLEYRCCNADEAFHAPRWRNRLYWRFLRHRPGNLDRFSESVVSACRELRPEILLVTGLLPLHAAALRAIGELKVLRLNFLTDDPWNPAHRSGRCFEALREYDWAFTPRRANLEQLRREGPHALYLPFGFEPGAHFIDPPSESERARLTCDLMFAGARDPDRVPYLRAAIAAGLDVHVYGIYWDRHRETRQAARGQVGGDILRKAVRGARINLCLVRRANRDGHSMRTFEIPAMGGCMLAERTAEHEEILGREGESVTYFDSPDEMVEKARWLIAHEPERLRMADALHRRIQSGGHTYRDRLASMLRQVGHATEASPKLDKILPYR